ncbi:MAG: SRPBCC domain-containing protein [Caldimonas sp.]
MLIDGSFEVAAPPAKVLAHLFDARLMASCLPGCESLEMLDADRYRAVIAMSLAGVKARFDLVVQITGRQADGIRAETRGDEGGNASTLSATSEVRLSPVGAGTRVDYTSDVAVTGRLGRFALGMMKKQAQNLGDAFAANLQAKLAEAAPVIDAPEPTDATPVVARVSTPVVEPVRATPQAPIDVTPAPARNGFVRWLRRLFGLDRASSGTTH